MDSNQIIKIDFNKLGDPLEKDNIFSREEVLKLASRPMFSARDRCLFAVLYLSNSRISEIVRRLKKKQIRFVYRREKEFMVFTGLYTEKNPEHPLRTVPVNIEREKELVGIVKSYIHTLSDDDILFPISRQQAWKIIKKMSGQRCHFLRHTRLTHLTVEYGLGSEAIKRLAGWRSDRMLKEYTHLQWKDIAGMMC